MADPPGIITHEDLMNAQPQLKDPLVTRVFGMDVLGVPPPSSSAAVLMALKFLDGYGSLDTMGDLLDHRLVHEALILTDATSDSPLPTCWCLDINKSTKPTIIRIARNITITSFFNIKGDFHL